MKYLIGALSLLLTTTVVADEIVQGFKNPSFSGIGTSAHYLTIENQEKSRRDQIQDDIESHLRLPNVRQKTQLLPNLYEILKAEFLRSYQSS